MDNATPSKLPYWLVNVDPAQQPAECPEYLLNVDENDKSNLGTSDADFHLMTWEKVKQIIVTNRNDMLRRVPSQLRKYLKYTWNIRKKYGSVMRFIVDERLKWKDLTPENSTPFMSKNDYKMLFNDWPYGLTVGIVHIVVWVKFALEDDPNTGDMTEETRSTIDTFVAEYFHTHLDPKDVLWFRNWASLKSVHAVEHFHVLLNNPDSAFVQEITGGDVPLIEKIGLE